METGRWGSSSELNISLELLALKHIVKKLFKGSKAELGCQISVLGSWCGKSLEVVFSVGTDAGSELKPLKDQE